MALIGLDVRMAGPVPSGLGTYAANLAGALVAADTSHHFVLIRSSNAAGLPGTGPRVSEVVVDGDIDGPRNVLRGGAVSRLGLDLYHSLHHFVPPRLRVPRVVITLHDLIWLEHAALCRTDRAGAMANHFFARALMPYAVRRADRVITVSGYVRGRAIEYFRVDAARVVAVLSGVDAACFPFATADPETTRPYFLVLGNTRPYKNVPTAIAAFAHCRKLHPALRLIVAGRGDATPAMQSVARRFGVEDGVTFTGPRSTADVVALMHGASALVFPSFTEGFGLPVVEAMAAGCPVIASNAPALVEVAAGAAIHCDASAPDQFAAAMDALVRDDGRLRASLRARGRARASELTWTRCAEGTLAVYAQLL
jgi:glycosyltransferase involved in cell wall biosynthesis